MSLKLTTQVLIKANPEEIWKELINFKSYPSWNPFITNIEGIPKKGNQLKVNIGNMKFKPIVLESIPNKKLAWKGKLIIKGLFDGQHSFEIIQKGKDSLFIQSEKFSGFLIPF